MICTRRTSDWHGNAFKLSLIGYTFTCEIAVRNSDWLYSLFSHVKIKRIDLYKWALWNTILVLCVINIVYVIESAAYGVLFTSCLCQKPERARYERVRAFDTNNSWIKPRTKHLLCRELFITQNKRIFIELAFWTQIRNKNSLTVEPNANLI